MSSYQRFTKNFGLIASTNIVIAAERIILLPIITKLLGAVNYGIWAQLGVTISLLTPLVLLGLPYALVRFLAGEKEKKEIQEGFYSVFALVFIITLIVASLLIIFSNSIAGFLQIPQVLVRILAVVISFECLNLVLLSLFQAFQEIKKYASFLILKAFGEISLVIVSIFLGYGIFGAVLSLLVIRIIIFSLLSALILKRIGIKIPVFSKIKSYLSFGLPTVLSGASYWAVASSDRYLIGFFLGILFVGYYASAYTIGNFLNFLIYPFIFMLPPVLSKLFDENKIDEVKNYLKYSLKYFLIIAIPACFGLSILSKQLITIFSTKEIAVNSYFITPFIVLSVLLYGIYIILVQILVMFKKTKIFGIIWLGVALLNIILNLIFISLYGIIAAALSTLISYSLALVLTWHYSFREFKFKIDWKTAIKSILASSLMALFIFWLNPAGLCKTVIAIIFGGLFYAILILLLKSFDQREINFVKKFL